MSTYLPTSESHEEINIRSQMINLLQSAPIPQEQILPNMGLFLNSKNLSRILFLNDMYNRILEIQGIIIDFGSRWGQNMGVFCALRGLYEPFNRHRKIVGFDTFCGFPDIHANDGSREWMKEKGLSVTTDYDQYLDKILRAHEQDGPISHIKRFDIRRGNAVNECPKYIKEHPETIISLAYFDFDLYEPTKACFLAIKDRLVKGSVVCFDEANDADAPGETIALMECIGLNNIRLCKHRYASRVSFFVME